MMTVLMQAKMETGLHLKCSVNTMVCIIAHIYMEIALYAGGKWHTMCKMYALIIHLFCDEGRGV